MRASDRCSIHRLGGSCLDCSLICLVSGSSQHRDGRTARQDGSNRCNAGQSAASDATHGAATVCVALAEFLDTRNGRGSSEEKTGKMPVTVCRITKFPVATEFARRSVRQCTCEPCEAYARSIEDSLSEKKNAGGDTADAV
jgi:hypothetical protein